MDLNEQLQEGFEPQEEKVEEPTQEQEIEEVPLFKHISDQLGWEADIDTYEESPEGLASYIKDYEHSVKQSTIQEVQESIFNNIQQSTPVLYDLLVRAINNDIDETALIKEYYNVLSYSEKSFEDLSIEDQRSIVKQAKFSDIDSEIAEDYLNKLQDNGTLANLAKSIYETESNQRKAQYDNLVQQKQYQQQQLEERANANAIKIRDIITNKNLETFAIPDRDVNPYLNFLQERLDYDEQGTLYIRMPLNTAKDLENTFYIFRGGKIEDLINAKAKTVAANNLFNKGKSSVPESDKNKKQELPNLFGHILNK